MRKLALAAALALAALGLVLPGLVRPARASAAGKSTAPKITMCGGAANDSMNTSSVSAASGSGLPWPCGP